MEVHSLTKFTRISPKKARQVAREIQGLPANDALELLAFIPRKAARFFAKTLKSAVANAENNHELASDTLIIKRAVIEDGPSMKRWKAGARGMVKPIKRRMSHFRIILTDSE